MSENQFCEALNNKLTNDEIAIRQNECSTCDHSDLIVCCCSVCHIKLQVVINERNCQVAHSEITIQYKKVMHDLDRYRSYITGTLAESNSI